MQVLSMRDEIKKAKAKAERHFIEAYGGRVDIRQWLEAHADSYGVASYRLELWVLEGSPAKGVVLANHGAGCIEAWGPHGESVYKRKGIWP